MKISEILSKRKLNNVEWDYHWDNKREGFCVTVNGKEASFFKAKGIFDRSGAQKEAEQLIVKLHGDAWSADKKAKDDEFQYKKPLTNLEKEWVALAKRVSKMDKMTDKELERYVTLGKEVVRRSLLDGTHPEVKK